MLLSSCMWDVLRGTVLSFSSWMYALVPYPVPCPVLVRFHAEAVQLTKATGSEPVREQLIVFHLLTELNHVSKESDECQP